MEMEPADLLAADSNDSTGSRNEPPRLLSNQSLINSTVWDKSEDEQNVINGVADFFLQLQQQQLSPSSPKSISDDDQRIFNTSSNTESANHSSSVRKRNGTITTALDIAALRKSLTGRPRLKRVCHICGRECPSRHKLQRHLSTHSEDRPYNCSICGKAFKWTEYLSKHMRTQHGSSPGPIITSTKPCVRHRSVESPIESNSGSVEPCSPARTRTCCHSSGGQRSSSTNSSSNTASQNSSKNKQPRRISATSDSTVPDTPSDIVYSPNGQSTASESTTTQQSGRNNSTSSGMMQTDPYHFPFSANQYPANGYYPGFYPLNPYNPYMNAAPYNFPHPYTNAMMQNYPYDPMMHAGYMIDTSIGTDVLPSDIFDPAGSAASTQSTSDKSSSVSCQTQDGPENPSNSTKGIIKKRPLVKIINMTSKKDVGIQCEVGDETIRALYDEDGYYKDPNNCVSPNSNCNSTDEGDLCNICKYPCEEDGCNRAYIHRKDLIRHMRIAHGINPIIMEPRVIETPAKPNICNIGDCNKSYYHMKDLRRHQRQFHMTTLVAGAQNFEGALENGITSLRYPCDFNGCAKSYIHKKDLIRHKRMFHSDASNHPSIPNPVIVLHMKKAKRNSEEQTSIDEDDSEPKRAHLDSCSSSGETALFNSSIDISTSPKTPLLSDINSMPSATSLMDSISAAVANMVSIEELSSQIFNMSPSTISSGLSNDTESSTSTADSYNSTGLLNDTNLLSTS